MCLINAAESLVALSIGLPRKPRVSGGKRAVRGRKCPKQCGFLSRTLFGGVVGCVKQTRSVHEAWLDEACGNGGQVAAIRFAVSERDP